MNGHRIEHKERQRFLAIWRTFSEENKKDEQGRTIPEFWTECYEKNFIAPMMGFCSEENKATYGLCTLLEDQKNRFNYGIGVLLNDKADKKELNRLLEKGYSIWKAEPNDYAVFSCMGTDAKCLDEMWHHFFADFSPESGYIHTGDIDFELYPEPKEEGLFCELWIPIKKR